MHLGQRPIGEKVALPIIAILLMSFLIGIHASVRIGNKIKNYFVAGNIIPFWVVALSLMGQAIELGGTQANAEASMTTGFWAGAVLPIGVGLSLIMIGLFFAEPLHRMKLLTLPDFYRRRYGRSVEIIVTLLCVISFVILLAGNLAGAGLILNHIVGINQVEALVGVGSIVTVYPMAGGLFAVTWNDILHVGVVLIGIVGTFVWIITTQDLAVLGQGFQERFSMTPMFNFSEGALANWSALLALALGDIVALDFMERVFAAKTPHFAKIACLVSGVLTMVVGTLVAGLGIMAFSLSTNVSDSQPFLAFTSGFLPAGILMMLYMGLISACISTCDGVLMSCSSTLTRNLFADLIPPKRLLLFSRLAPIPVAVIAICVAYIKPEPGGLLVLAFDVVFASCMVPLTLGIYWKRATQSAAFWGMLLPFFLRILLEFLVPPNWAGLQTLIPPVFSLVIMVVLSLSRKGSRHAD